MEGTDSTRRGTTMNSAIYIDRARAWGARLEDREAMRSGLPIKEARPIVARRTGVSTGALTNLRKNRLKSIAAHVYDRLRAAVERELQGELAALQHELAVLRQTGVDPRGPEVSEAEAHLAAARRALGLND